MYLFITILLHEGIETIIIYDGPYIRMYNNKNEKKIEKHTRDEILFLKEYRRFFVVYKHTFDLSDSVTIQACHRLVDLNNVYLYILFIREKLILSSGRIPWGN